MAIYKKQTYFLNKKVLIFKSDKYLILNAKSSKLNSYKLCGLFTRQKIIDLNY